ncbi:MAG: two-component system, OmpR family, sensor histidine kinase MprB, partial [Frankiaceae bacterium]|nr:two-component system, OmpR family, sensor histidine kinase MprB [Frankiaceae bacterium]
MKSPLARARRGAQGFDRRWRDLPLRTRLTTVASLAATLAIVSVIAVAYIAVRHELRTQIDRQLHRQARELKVQNDPFNGGGYTINTGAGDLGGYSQSVAANGQTGPHSDPLPVSAEDVRIARAGHGSAIRDAEFRGEPVRILTTGGAL